MLKGLRTYFGLLARYVAIFFAARLVFFLVFSGGHHSGGDIAKAFFIGARLDLSISATLLCAAAFLATFAGFVRVFEWLLKPLVMLYMALLNATLSVLVAAEFPFYKEYSSRLNHLFFEYFDKPKELFVTILGIKYVALLFIAAPLVVWLAAAAGVRQSRKMFDRNRGEGFFSRIASLALIAGFTVLFIRGGFQNRPLNWGEAFFSPDNFMNQTALNGVFNLYADIQIFLEERALHVKPSGYFAPPEMAFKAVKDVSRYGVPAPKGDNPVALTKGTRPNVVMIFMESFAARYTGALGAKEPYTPEFDRLSKRGVLFTRFYGNGTRTSRGLAAALNSFPPMAGVNISKKVEAQQKIPGIAAYLGDMGYDTVFFYGGDRHFEDMSGFEINSGFREFYDCADFRNPRHKNPIGVFDEELFENVDRVLRGRKQPFFAAVMTLSNHGPFTVPPDFPARPGVPRERLAFLYSDYALGRFISMAEKSPHYKNTVFIITADHAAFIEDYGADRFHIPLLFLSPMLKSARDGRVASQLDLPATVLEMCGAKIKSADTAFWGLSLAQRKTRGMAFFLDDPYFGVITRDAMYREGFEGGGYVYDLSGGLSPAAFPQELINYARGMKEGGAQLFFSRKAASKWKEE
ncbi:MAG: sulfatase-like hydrolase/transferase [Elusimicrobiales bacterium]